MALLNFKTPSKHPLAPTPLQSERFSEKVEKKNKLEQQQLYVPMKTIRWWMSQYIIRTFEKEFGTMYQILFRTDLDAIPRVEETKELGYSL